MTNQFYGVGWSRENQLSWWVSDASDRNRAVNVDAKTLKFIAAAEAVFRAGYDTVSAQSRPTPADRSDSLSTLRCRPTNVGWYLLTN